MSKIKTQADFEKDKVLKAQYGTYDQYLSLNNPSLSDYVSVAETGDLPKEQPKSPYDAYMEEAKRIYNQGVESNNQIAESQSASAGAEYREVNRNINEINKASGKANTGYAGDTSIDAYNAYRNAVNSAYSNAQKSNNDLYSYYLGEMSRLQQAKENQEVTERQLSMQEEEYQGDKETDVLSEVSNFLSQDNAFNPDGTISNDTALKTWNYIKRIYGDNIPNSTMAYLESQDGFSEWLNEYNSGKSNDYIEKHEYQNYDFEVNIDGNKYNLRTGPLVNENYISVLDSIISGKKSPMKTVYYNGKLYVVDGELNWREVISGKSNVNDVLNAYTKTTQLK